MKNLQMPHSYISVSEEELRSISGGGPLGDALDLFFSNLRLDDLFFSGGLISLSFTFVPMLLFNVVKTGFNFVVSAYDTIADLFHFSHEERDMVQYISDQQQRREEYHHTDKADQDADHKADTHIRTDLEIHKQQRHKAEQCGQHTGADGTHR